MINRICISINNRCNLACRYCHFREKGKIESSDMNVFEILDNVKAYATQKFKIGFVGNGEGFLDWELLKSYIKYIEDNPFISAYTITNGTIRLPDDDIRFLEDHHINVGFSIDGKIITVAIRLTVLFPMWSIIKVSQVIIPHLTPLSAKKALKMPIK